MPLNLVSEIQRIVSNASIDELRTVEAIGKVFGNRVEKIIGPAYHGWIEAHKTGHKSEFFVVEISTSQIDKLTYLCKSDPDGWKDAGFDGNLDVIFAATVNEQVAALSGYNVDSLGAANISVFCHSDFRGRGLARETAVAEIYREITED